MRQKSRPQGSAEKTIKDIRRATRKRYATEEKIRIALEGLRDEYSIAELCRRDRPLARSLTLEAIQPFDFTLKKLLSKFHRNRNFFHHLQVPSGYRSDVIRNREIEPVCIKLILLAFSGAGSGNRTRIFSLEGFCYTRKCTVTRASSSEYCIISH